MSHKKSTIKKAAKDKGETHAEEPQYKVSRKLAAERFPIVGLGASAGGLEALRTFFSEVSEESAMAYIVLVHLPPKQPSMMADLLQRDARIPVSTARDGQLIEAGHVYVIPPDKEISVYKGRIQLMDIAPKRVYLPIDSFFSSLALDQGPNAAAIILSGTGTDGTLGVKEIKANDGLVLVQSEGSAGYDGMPRSAIGTGLVDMILAPEEMPKKLDHYFRDSRTSFAKVSATASDAAKGDQQQWLSKVLAILRARVGHDFSVYKHNTIFRRIERRMRLNQIKSRETYLRFLRENPDELEALFRELLIGVTYFFRDPESFEVLKTRVVPQLLKQMKNNAIFRAWIPGCSTGEEVYSLAIVLRECMDKVSRPIGLQLFGTDINKYAIEKAREGLFPASIATEVSAERLNSFFIEEGNFFRIRKEIRDFVVFSVQDVLIDPPFSRLNLLCCRNLMIYLAAEAQKKLLPLFHYTLSPGGILMLGTSETIGGFTRLFEILDKKWKIFRRREVPETLRQMVDFPSRAVKAEPADRISSGVSETQKTNLAQLTQKTILDQFAPPAILIDARGQILHVQGRTGKYLETPSGPPSFNILDLAREGLRIELSSALRAAKSSKNNVLRRRVAVKTNGDVQMINLHVRPQDVPDKLAEKFLVVFEDIEAASVAPVSEKLERGQPLPESSSLAELEKELRFTKESHQTAIEELESSNEELKSTNEELQSSNEELQSTNEELESSREELQSLNEELQTVNAELQNKLEDLSAAHDDMQNLLNSTEIATIFVDNDMRIRRFTSEATNIVNIIQTDIGRPLKHITTNLSYEAMIDDLTEVLEKLTPRKVEVKTVKGNWYHMHIIPYRTTNNRIEGAILTFTNIDDQKKAQKMIEESTLQLVRAIFDMSPMPMLVLDKDAKMVIANTAFSETIKITQEDIKGKDVYSLQGSITDQLKLKSKLENALRKKMNFETEVFEMETQQGKTRFSIDGRIIESDADFPYRLLLEFIMKQ